MRIGLIGETIALLRAEGVRRIYGCGELHLMQWGHPALGADGGGPDGARRVRLIDAPAPWGEHERRYPSLRRHD